MKHEYVRLNDAAREKLEAIIQQRQEETGVAPKANAVVIEALHKLGAENARD